MKKWNLINQLNLGAHLQTQNYLEGDNKWIFLTNSSF